jgi:hypothetical protein
MDRLLRHAFLVSLVAFGLALLGSRDPDAGTRSVHTEPFADAR